ncbi:MAG: DUF63 family protein [Candidatus Aenigmarchaeota archaeon]|nr:DUF63 family protein [Candidatus Aenigmarchaeota archaeon]
MLSFIQKYYIDPIVYGTGYNIFNTLTYGIIFAVMVFAVYRLLKKWKICIDEKFLLSVLPYILLGSVFRVLEDAGIFKSPLFVTPLVFIITFLLAVAALWLSRELEKRLKKSYHIIWLLIGAALCVLFGSMRYVKNTGAFIVLRIFALFVAGVYLARELKLTLLYRENAWVFLSHVFDATTTFVAIQFFPYTEQHVIAGLAIASLGPWSMYLLKIPVVLAALWVIDRDVKNRNQNMFIKFAIIVLGLGPGLRNFLRLMMGV